MQMILAAGMAIAFSRTVTLYINQNSISIKTPSQSGHWKIDLEKPGYI
jgi:hypothetical protein